MFNRISDRVYFKDAEPYSDRSTIGYVKGDKFSLLFDSGASGIHAMETKNDLDSAFLPYPSLVALSHYHWDHSFGLHYWSCPSIASKETNTELRKLSQYKWDEEAIKRRVEKGEEIVFCHEMMKREYGDTERIRVIPATMSFEGKIEIDLGGVRCILHHIGGPHSSDSVVLYVVEDRIIFLGDSHSKDLYGYPWHFDINEEEKFFENISVIPYDRDKTEKYIQHMDSYDFTIAIPGHSYPMERKELFSVFS